MAADHVHRKNVGRGRELHKRVQHRNVLDRRGCLDMLYDQVGLLIHSRIKKYTV